MSLKINIKKGKKMGFGGLGKILGGVASGGLSYANGIGSILNDVSGATSAAKVSQKYALQSGAINHAYQKEFAQNAHQWEVADMEAAGINPMLSAGGTGASASGGGVNSASQQASGIDILGTLLNTVGTINNAKKMSAEAKNLDANTKLTDVNTKLQPLIVEAQNARNWGDYNVAMKKIEQMGEEIKAIQAGTENTKANTENTKENTRINKFKNDWDIEHPKFYTLKQYTDWLEHATNTGKNLADTIATVHDTFGGKGSIFKTKGRRQ